MRRRFIALLATVVLLVAGFTAAAVASGGEPFGFLASRPVAPAQQHAVARQAARDRNIAERKAKPAPVSTGESADEDSSKDDSAEEEGEAEEPTAATHKVTICHHTGSWRHPFHSITVDEHAGAAHTAHGDTVGPCPQTATSARPKASREKPKPAHGPKRPQRSEHGPPPGRGNSDHERSAGRDKKR